MNDTLETISLTLLGGAAALDFVNTKSGRDTDLALDHLTSAEALLTWAAHAGLIDAPATEAASSTVLPRALALREAIYRIFSAIADGRLPLDADLDHLRDMTASQIAGLRLHRLDDGTFNWSKPGTTMTCESLLTRLALDAIDVLRFSDLSRLKQCHGHDCGWVFLDTTKNRSRRWCDMAVCGNRAKAKRHRSRIRCD